MDGKGLTGRALRWQVQSGLEIYSKAGRIYLLRFGQRAGCCPVEAEGTLVPGKS
jgi:hypothetical protein